MLVIDTERLNILPLNQSHLELCISNFNKLERALGLTITDKELSDREKNVYEIRLKNVEDNPINYMWYTVWIIALKKENRFIGSIMIKNFPSENGEVVIGYSIESDYRCNDFMTEALKSLTKWMFSNPEVKIILADTLKNNIPSHRVLQKIGMVKYMEDDECYWWRLAK
ncbi:GNAT family N-acetyltransferase [Clostridium sp. YIM B02515]|uniref:GNAT family N-acetyltransferase n=1 Tax=Clostridium rhizosphaerae TaxID=2803861 RepID=A0ABS1T614_9CLOT|nr:GNAT family N-acetyltransferase [Clostridium rhizosphaerae]MBL4934775.1 GNAT family N-acetyltransferase [Clostridium rhizosphaerae]